MSILDHTPAGLRAGRWTVDPQRSRLELDMRVAGMVGLRGRFTGMSGHLDLGRDTGPDLGPGPPGGAVFVEVETGSLTTGSGYRDRILTGAGIIDPQAGPTITYRSHTITPVGAGWRVAGVLGTARCALPLRLAVESSRCTPTEIRLSAHGSITRDEMVRLLTRPGAAALLGPSADLDLTITLSLPAGTR